MIPLRYQAEPLSAALREGWLDWSLDFFTADDAVQNPHVDITVQLDVTDAYQHYQSVKHLGGTFFACLLWHLARTLACHPSFNLRKVDGAWYILHNPPVFVPVAVGGRWRFQEMLLEDTYRMEYADFVPYYEDNLCKARSFDLTRGNASEQFHLAHSIGNLPNLQFTGLTLHWHATRMIGQPFFYFGKRYAVDDKLFIPLAAKLHHACTDPLVFDQLIQDFQRGFK